jgi:hypothetical protein
MDENNVCMKSKCTKCISFGLFEDVQIEDKKRRGTRNPSCRYDVLEEISPSFRWVWGFDVAQLSKFPLYQRGPQ